MPTAKLSTLMCSLFVAFPLEYRATLIGRVTDAHGAVIPSAVISAANRNNGMKSETESGSDGRYVIPFLPPGPYTITAAFPGFRKYILENLQISTGERVSVDIRMTIGQMTEPITVQGKASMPSTRTATLRQVIRLLPARAADGSRNDFGSYLVIGTVMRISVGMHTICVKQASILGYTKTFIECYSVAPAVVLGRVHRGDSITAVLSRDNDRLIRLRVAPRHVQRN